MTQEQILPCRFFLRETRPARAEWAVHLKRLPARYRRQSVSEAIRIGCYACHKRPGIRLSDAFFRAIARR